MLFRQFCNYICKVDLLFLSNECLTLFKKIV